MKIFESVTLGSVTLNNRIVMAPLTRSRAIGNIPNELMVKYYSERATAGLIITEGTSPSPNGLGYARIPGCYSPDQVAGWKKVTTAVHQKGGRIFLQIMHCGRVGHPLNLPKGAKMLAPSVLAAPGQMYTDQEGPKDHPAPSAMTEAEIRSTISEYSNCAKLAIEAGFDGVELHAANGYLIDQFLNTAANQRTDQWGGTVENRIRFALEVAKAVTAVIPADKVGMRISPYGAFNGTQADPQMDELYEKLSHELSKLKLVYIHVVDHSSMGAPAVSAQLKAKIRDLFKGAYILSGGYDSAAKAEADVQAHKGDLVAFGRLFISNPNLVTKLKAGSALTSPDSNTFYTPGEKGYTDYPA